MSEFLNIAIVQSDLVWENSENNRKNFDKKIKEIPAEIDLIIIPEMFTTGFTMNTKKVAETMDGITIAWMLQKAKEKDALVMGSIIIKENNKFYNRLIVTFPSGKLKYYDKRHLFSFAGEDKLFTAGNKKLIFKYKGFKICPLICYDLRFPVWARNTESYDILIYIANWPNARITAWDTLLKARAIENICYSIGINRVGLDGNNLVYNGHSAVYDFFGKALLSFNEKKESIKTISLSKKEIEDTRKKFRFLDDMDKFEIH